MKSPHQKMVALLVAQNNLEAPSQIPLKWLTRNLYRRPLLYWVCKAAEDCTQVDAIYIITQDKTVAHTATTLGLGKIRVLDTWSETPSQDWLVQQISEYAGCPYVAMLQPTAPLLSAPDLKRGYLKIQQGQYDRVVSVTRQRQPSWRITVDDDTSGEPALPDLSENRWVENGAFHITRVPSSPHEGNVGLVEMAQESRYSLQQESDWGAIESVLRELQSQQNAPLKERLSRVRLVATDVDGCLTDGGMCYAEDGGQYKHFNAKDGMGATLLRAAGFLVAFITRDSTALVQRRGEKLQVDEIHQGALDKEVVMEDILQRRGLSWEEIAYLGDDVIDLGVLRRVGISACPADALPEIRKEVDIVLNLPGGAGAFRELAAYFLPDINTLSF